MKLSSPNGIALKWTANILLLLIGIVFVLPLVWVVLASFDGSATLSVAWPKQWTPRAAWSNRTATWPSSLKTQSRIK